MLPVIVETKRNGRSTEGGPGTVVVAVGFGAVVDVEGAPVVVDACFEEFDTRPDDAGFAFDPDPNA